MNPLIEDNREELNILCIRYGMRRLSLFGSAATGGWSPETSDLDFLIDPGDYDDRVARRLMGFLAGLERLFGDRFDAITERSLRTVAMREEVNRTAITLYEHPGQQQVA